MNEYDEFWLSRTLKLLGKKMTVENTPLADEPATRATRGNSRSWRSWILGTLLGAVLTVVLVGALVWLSTGLGLLLPDWHVARRTHADQCGSADRGSSNPATPAIGNRELYHG